MPYDAIAASNIEGQSGPFIDFMLNEILKTLQSGIRETVPNKVPDKVSDKVPNKVPNKSELSVLRLLSDNHGMTRSELAGNMGITESGVKKIISNMRKAGWIERRGSNKSGYWIVKYDLNG